MASGLQPHQFIQLYTGVKMIIQKGCPSKHPLLLNESPLISIGDLDFFLTISSPCNDRIPGKHDGLCIGAAFDRPQCGNTDGVMRPSHLVFDLDSFALELPLPDSIY
jgi:hypothetical protein